ncbi:MARVEL domain-containing protein 1 [Condylostylus longicornis]|uniref:MARVEL domain-containing protein 1 n=1 Tax=Condylostylus longicornis TaxID=2530218 RepID=UPI00244E216F|nr:MARVEL domain-containing protein 1 [Condylostylus longicornis]
MTETVITIQQQPKTTASAPAGQNATAGIRINIEYFKTLPGILKLVQLLLGIICMALASPAAASVTHFFLFVAVTSFIATLLWAFAYFLSVRENLNLAINWILTELLNTALVTLLYLIAFIVQLSGWSTYYHPWSGSNIAAGVFGLFNTLAYVAGCYLLFIEHRSGATQ